MSEVDSKSAQDTIKVDATVKKESEELSNKIDEGDIFGFCGSSKKNDKNYAPMVITKFATHYKLNHTHRGVAVIFNHELFDSPKLLTRNGTNADAFNLEGCMKKLGFQVKSYKDLSIKDLMEEIELISKMDHSNNDCFVMFVLTHGEEGILHSRNAPYKHNELFTNFTADKCKSLAGKPKLFFIQACQGDKLDPGINLRTETDSSSIYKIPLHADFLIAYSTLPGYYSWRNTQRGSWFIQALCTEIQENVYNCDILTLLTSVNRRVAIDFESNVPNDSTMHAQKQIPWITYTLTRILHFGPKSSPRNNVD